MTKQINELTDFQLGALAEAGNIGAGHAAIALSQLIGRKIMVAVTKVRVVSLEEYIKLIGEPDSLIIGVFLRVLGDVQGAILLVLLREPALTLVDVLMNQKIGSTRILGEIEQSALKEAGSILSGSYLNALSELAHFTLIPSVPKMAFDKAGVVFKSIFEPMRQELGLVVGVETEFVEASTRIKGHFLFMPDENGIKMILKALGA